LVLLVAGGGYLNYNRNAHLDADLEFRPYKTLSDEDIQTLIDAQGEQVQQMVSSLSGQAPDARVGHLAPSDMQARLEAFESFQSEHQRWRESHRELLSGQVMVDALRKEQEIRAAGLHKPWVRILRRVTTI
jgi:hypothetical protein